MAELDDVSVWVGNSREVFSVDRAGAVRGKVAVEAGLEALACVVMKDGSSVLVTIDGSGRMELRSTASLAVVGSVILYGGAASNASPTHSQHSSPVRGRSSSPVPQPVFVHASLSPAGRNSVGGPSITFASSPVAVRTGSLLNPHNSAVPAAAATAAQGSSSRILGVVEGSGIVFTRGRRVGIVWAGARTEWVAEAEVGAVVPRGYAASSDDEIWLAASSSSSSLSPSSSTASGITVISGKGTVLAKLALPAASASEPLVALLSVPGLVFGVTKTKVFAWHSAERRVIGTVALKEGVEALGATPQPGAPMGILVVLPHSLLEVGVQDDAKTRKFSWRITSAARRLSNSSSAAAAATAGAAVASGEGPTAAAAAGGSAPANSNSNDDDDDDDLPINEVVRKGEATEENAGDPGRTASLATAQEEIGRLRAANLRLVKEKQALRQHLDRAVGPSASSPSASHASELAILADELEEARFAVKQRDALLVESTVLVTRMQAESKALEERLTRSRMEVEAALEASQKATLEAREARGAAETRSAALEEELANVRRAGQSANAMLTGELFGLRKDLEAAKKAAADAEQLAAERAAQVESARASKEDIKATLGAKAEALAEQLRGVEHERRARDETISSLETALDEAIERIIALERCPTAEEVLGRSAGTQHDTLGPEVRKARTEREALASTVSTLSEANISLADRLQSLEAEALRLRGERDEAEAQLAASRAELRRTQGLGEAKQELEDQLEHANEARARLAHERAALTQDLESKRMQLVLSQGLVEELRAASAHERESADRLQAEVRALQRGLDSSSEELAAASSRVHELEARLRRQETDHARALDQAQAAHRESLGELERALDRVQDEMETACGRLNDAEARRERDLAERRSLEQTVAQLREQSSAEVERLSSQVAVLRNENSRLRDVSDTNQSLRAKLAETAARLEQLDSATAAEREDVRSSQQALHVELIEAREQARLALEQKAALLYEFDRLDEERHRLQTTNTALRDEISAARAIIRQYSDQGRILVSSVGGISGKNSTHTANNTTTTIHGAPQPLPPQQPTTAGDLSSLLQAVKQTLEHTREEYEILHHHNIQNVINIDPSATSASSSSTTTTTTTRPGKAQPKVPN
jgi:hypothetical protein